LYNVTNIPVSTFTIDFACERGDLTFNTVEASSVVYCSDVNAINDKELFNKFNYYPNPTTGLLTIEAENMQRVEVIDLQGKTLLDISINNQNAEVINLSEMPKGIFFVKVITGKGVAVEKVVYE